MSPDLVSFLAGFVAGLGLARWILGRHIRALLDALFWLSKPDGCFLGRRTPQPRNPGPILSPRL
jgi:hypothetical protein